MSDATPTRSVVLELKDERRAMHEGYVFLDEKCLLLAGEILRELARYAALRRELRRGMVGRASTRLQAAVARHGLHGLQVYPAADSPARSSRASARSLMGVRLQDAALDGDAPRRAGRRRRFAGSRGLPPRVRRRCSAAAAPLAAVTGNLERLSLEYRRSVRRARALQDVLLPELDRAVSEIETRLEELEQEDAIWMRQGRA